MSVGELMSKWGWGGADCPDCAKIQASVLEELQPTVKATSTRALAAALAHLLQAKTEGRELAPYQEKVPFIDVRCGVLQHVAVCGSMLQCVAADLCCASAISRDGIAIAACCSVVQCVAVCCSVPLCCSVLKSE